MSSSTTRWSTSSVAAIPQFDIRTISQFLIGFIVLSFYHHFLLGKRNPGAPPLIKSWIPFFGVAFSFSRDPERLILQCKERYGDIFTLYMVGRKMNIVCDPEGIQVVFRDDKTFPFFKMSYGFAQSLFGMTQKQGNDADLQQAHHKVFTPNLFAQEKVTSLIQQFNSHLQTIWIRELKRLDVDGKLSNEGVVVDLDLWIYRIMFESGGKMFFGETWPTDDDFFNDCRTFDDGTYTFFKYPHFMIQKSVEARERYYKRMLAMFKDGLVNESDLVKERLRVELDLGYSLEDTMRSMMGLAFALQTNAIPATFWLVASLSSLPPDQKQEVLDRIQQYILPESSTKESTAFDIDKLSQDPLLESALSETLRLHMNGLFPREIQKDTTLTINGRTYRLSKDEWVFLSMAGVHKSAHIYDDPRSFQLKRFVDMHTKSQGDKFEAYKFFTTSGVRVRNPVIWWGGGMHACAGRRFAVKEVLLLASTILHQFEITAVDGDTPLEPPVPESTSRYGGGTEFPARHWTVRLKYRK